MMGRHQKEACSRLGRELFRQTGESHLSEFIPACARESVSFAFANYNYRFPCASVPFPARQNFRRHPGTRHTENRVPVGGEFVTRFFGLPGFGFLNSVNASLGFLSLAKRT